MAEKLRTAYHHGDLRNALLEKALEHLKTQDAAHLSVREISKELGVSPAAAYRHFADKQALVDALIVEGFHKLAEKGSRYVKRAGEDTLEQLVALGQAYVEFGLEHPEYTRIMFAARDVPVKAIDEAGHEVKELLHAVLTNLYHTTKLTKTKQEEAFGIIWSTIHGMTVLVMDKQMPWIAQSKAQAKALVRQGLEAVYRGLG